MESFINAPVEPNTSGCGNDDGNIKQSKVVGSTNSRNDSNIKGDGIGLEYQFTSVVRGFFGGSAFQTRGTSRYFVSDVIVGRHNEEHNQLLEFICQKVRQHPSEFALISNHGDHIHFLHDCAYSNRSCRCAWYKTIPNIAECLRKKIRKVRLMSSFEQRDWYNIIYYYCTNGRQCCYLKFRGRYRRIPMGSHNLQIGTYRGSGSEGEMEKDFQEGVRNLQCGFECGKSGGQLTNSSTKSNKSAGQYGNQIQQKIQLLMYKYPTTPIKGIVDIMEWLDDPILRDVRNDHTLFKNAIDVWSKKICRWSMSEFKEYYSDIIVKPSFGAGYMSKDFLYYNIEESFDIMENILKFQFDDSEMLISSFVNNLYNVLERKVPKLNSLLIYSPPSAGKNFFIDCFLDYMLVKGNLGNPNKNNQFAYQECYGKRVLLWNEPNYENSEIENLKLLLGGDVLSVRVKNKEDAPVYRTPVIILTNNVISIMNNYAFKDRMCQYKWKTMPLLKNYNKKPYPMVVEKIIEKYVT